MLVEEFVKTWRCGKCSAQQDIHVTVDRGDGRPSVWPTGWGCYPEICPVCGDCDAGFLALASQKESAWLEYLNAFDEFEKNPSGVLGVARDAAWQRYIAARKQSDEAQAALDHARVAWEALRAARARFHEICARHV